MFSGACAVLFFQFDDRGADLVSVHFQYLSYTCDVYIFNTCIVIICCFIGFFRTHSLFWLALRTQPPALPTSRPPNFPPSLPVAYLVELHRVDCKWNILFILYCDDCVFDLVLHVFFIHLAYPSLILQLETFYNLRCLWVIVDIAQVILRGTENSSTIKFKLNLKQSC